MVGRMQTTSECEQRTHDSKGRGGAMYAAVLAPTHREIVWSSVSCKVFFPMKSVFYLPFDIENLLWFSSALFFLYRCYSCHHEKKWEEERKNRHPPSTLHPSAGPRVAPRTAPQAPSPGVRNTPRSPQAPAWAVARGSLSLHEWLVPKSSHPTHSIKIITVYPSSTIPEELFCRMFLFR